jgi:hypothetical protein
MGLDSVESEDQTRELSLRAAYIFGSTHGLQAETGEIRNMTIERGFPYTSSLRRGYIVELFEKHNIFEAFKDDHWSFGNTPAGKAKRRRYLRIREQYKEFMAGGDSELESDADLDSEAEFDEAAGEQQFAAESDLRDFLANNPGCIEQGLSVYDENGRGGVEFHIDGGFIDILAKDRDGRFVVVELKVCRGRNKTVGQLLYYMGWVDQNMGNGPCRGIIIAKEISDDLALAAARVPWN